MGAYKGSKASEVMMTLEEYEERVAAQGASAPSGQDGSEDE